MAYTGWDRSNAVQELGYGESPTSFQVVLTEGQYVPIRIVWANAQGGASFYYSIVAPDGTVLLDDGTGPSDAIVQYSCDGVTAPPYEPFGSET